MATNQIEFSLKIGDLCDRFQISRPTIYRYVAASRKAAAAAAAAGGLIPALQRQGIFRFRSNSERHSNRLPGGWWPMLTPGWQLA